MEWTLRVIVRLGFIFVWFLIGYCPYNDFVMGVFSSICSIIMMEIFYYVDKKTVGIDKILGRLDYLDETIEESEKTETVILDELMINEENIKDDSEYSKGIKKGIDISRGVIKNRFKEVAEALSIKRSDIS